jgi:hypothetical protein
LLTPTFLPASIDLSLIDARGLIMKRVLIGAVLFAGVVAGANPSKAAGVAAIGVSPRQATEWSYGYAFGDDAERKALRICRGADPDVAVPKNASAAQSQCKVYVFSNQCIAFATTSMDVNTPAIGIGWAIAGDQAAARSQAIARCASMVGKRSAACVIQNSACDGSAK